MRIAFLSLALALSAPARIAPAQGSAGAIEGTAASDETGAPIAFALVRLVRADSAYDDRLRGVTSAEGRWAFAGVPAGEYRVELLRIGFRPVRSKALHVAPGETVRHELRVATLPVQLPTVEVRAAEMPACVPGDRLAEAPAVGALWEQVRRGVEVRRAVERRYRFRRSITQDTELRIRLFPNAREHRVDTMVYEPDSMVAQEERARAQRRAQGFGRGSTVQVPSEKALVEDEFLAEHCLDPTPREGGGAVGVRFRPSAPRRGVHGLRGTVWLDSASYLVQRIEYEHLDGGRPFTRVVVEYGDVTIGASTLRMPVRSSLSIGMRGGLRVGISGTRSTLTFDYWGFEDVAGR